MAQALHARCSTRSQRAVLQVVRRRRAERLLQLSRPPPARRQPDKTAIIFEADDGKVTQITYQELHRRVCMFANGLKSRGIKQGRPRHRLHADVDRGRGRDAGVRAHRRRSTRSCSAASRRRACRSASSTPAPSRCSPPTSRCAADARSRSRPRSTRRSRWAAASRSRTVVVYKRTGSEVKWDAQARRLAARPGEGAARDLRAGMGRRRAPALHPLHLGLDRQAQGHTALHRRLPAVDASSP